MYFVIVVIYDMSLTGQYGEDIHSQLIVQFCEALLGLLDFGKHEQKGGFSGMHVMS